MDEHLGTTDLFIKQLSPMSRWCWSTDDFGLKNVTVRIIEYKMAEDPYPDRPDLCRVYIKVKLEYTNLEGKYNERFYDTAVNGYKYK